MPRPPVLLESSSPESSIRRTTPMKQLWLRDTGRTLRPSCQCRVRTGP